MTCSADLTNGARFLIMQAAGETLLVSCMWVIAELGARSAMPLEHLGDSFLAIVRDWPSLTRRQVLGLTLRLERRNAEIVAAQKEAAETLATSRRPSPRGKSKRTHSGGRRLDVAA